MLLLGQLQDTIEDLNRVGGVQRSIPIQVLRILLGRTGSTTLRVRFSQNDWSLSPLRKGCHDFESLVDCGELVLNAHLHVIPLPSGRSLGMKADEIQPGSNLAAGIIFSTHAMLEKGAEKIRSLWIGRPRCVGASDACLWKRSQYRLNRKIVKL